MYFLCDVRWKAISGNRRGSVTFDDGIAYDMLPPFTRNIVRYPLSWLYPNLHHQNVALRTLYLDQLLLSELNSYTYDVNSQNDNDHRSVTDTSNIPTSTAINSDVESKRRYRIVTLGGGFDTRSIKFALKTRQQQQHQQQQHNHNRQKQDLTQSPSIFNLAILQWMKRKTSKTYASTRYDDNNFIVNSNVFEFHEIDLPHVIDQKRKILNRFLQRRKLFHGNTEILPKLYKANLNNITAIENCLNEIDNNDHHREYSYGSSDYDDDDSNNSCTSKTKSIQSNLKKRYYKTIIITEAVLMYLNEDNIKPLLQTCIDKLSKNSDNLSLCFTDRFPGIRIPTTASSTTTLTGTTSTASSTMIPISSSASTSSTDDEKSDVQNYLKSINLNLTKWLTKPGRARHMGVAVYTKGR
jgi:hypothetical protein